MKGSCQTLKNIPEWDFKQGDKDSKRGFVSREEPMYACFDQCC